MLVPSPWGERQGEGGPKHKTHHASHPAFGVADEREDLFHAIGHQQVLAECWIADETADPGQDLQMLRDRCRHEQKEKSGGLGVNRPVGDSLFVSAKDDDRFFDQPDEGVAGVRQGHAVADSRAVKLLAFLEGAEEGLARFRLVGNLGDLCDQFVEHLVAPASDQPQFNGRGGNQVTDQKSVCAAGGHVSERVFRARAVEDKCSPLPSGMGCR